MSVNIDNVALRRYGICWSEEKKSKRLDKN
jgi:hypothetical protein